MSEAEIQRMIEIFCTLINSPQLALTSDEEKFLTELNFWDNRSLRNFVTAFLKKVQPKANYNDRVLSELTFKYPQIAPDTIKKFNKTFKSFSLKQQQAILSVLCCKDDADEAVYDFAVSNFELMLNAAGYDLDELAIKLKIKAENGHFPDESEEDHDE